MQYNEDYVLGVLQDGGLVTRQQIDAARSRLNGEHRVPDVLIDDGILSEVDVSRTLATQAHMDWIDISTMIIPPQVINEIRGEDARRFKVIPVAFGESGLVVAVGNPLDIDTIDSLSFLLQRELELVCTSPKKIREGLIKYYGTADEAADVLQKELGEDIDLGLELGDGAEPMPNRRSRRADCPAGIDVANRGAPCWRERYSPRTDGQKVSCSLSHRWRASGNAIAAKTTAISHCQPAQDHDRLDQYRRETPAAGWSHPGEDQKKAHRPSRLYHA